MQDVSSVSVCVLPGLGLYCGRNREGRARVFHTLGQERVKFRRNCKRFLGHNTCDTIAITDYTSTYKLVQSSDQYVTVIFVPA